MPGSFIRSSLLAELRSALGALFVACALCVLFGASWVIPCMFSCEVPAGGVFFALLSGAAPCACTGGAVVRQRTKSEAAQHANRRFMKLLQRGVGYGTPVRPPRSRRDRVSKNAAVCSMGMNRRGNTEDRGGRTVPRWADPEVRAFERSRRTGPEKPARASERRGIPRPVAL